MVTPTNGEMVEIVNPTNETVDLSDYYLTDAVKQSTGKYYYNLPGATDFWSTSVSDFIARFPEGTIIDSGDTLLISMHTDSLFHSYYGIQSDLSLFEDMENAIEGITTISYGDNFFEWDLLGNDAEVLILFYWNGMSTTVQDVDYFLWGNTTHAVDKTGILTYEDDTSIENQNPIRTYSNSEIVDSMYVRINFEEVSETQTSGNGLTGHNETSENFTQSWSVAPQYEVIMGCTDPAASNFNPEATVDDGSCEYVIAISDIVYNCSEELGDSLECSGQYDLSETSAEGCPLYGEPVTTTGVVIDYFDITPYNGPHSFTIRGGDGSQIDFVVWPESSSYQDGFDITQTDLYVLADASTFGTYEVKVTGELGAYCDDDELLDIYSEWQVTVEYEIDIEITAQYNIDDFGCTDENASNFDPTALIDDGSCEYFPENLSFSAEPYPFVPSIGEKLMYTYAVPNGHRCKIRVFDNSGRFITSLLDGIPEFSSDDEVKTDYWDGRDNTNRLVPPGVYIMHFQATEVETGTQSTDSAPVVIGVVGR